MCARRVLAGITLLAIWQISTAAESEIQNVDKTLDARVKVFTVAGPYQKGSTRLEVLAPDTLEPGRTYRVVYVLPVNPGITGKWGSGIREAARTDIANRYGVICVAPEFEITPWFADHPTDPAVRQESHLLHTVLPFVEANLPVMRSREGRLLLGFSKSGYGAIMLLLRHTGLFDKAATWDAPLDHPKPDKWDMLDVFGSQENYGRYFIPMLLRQQASELRTQPPRIILMPCAGGDHPMDTIHKMMFDLRIPHLWEPTPHYKHHWEGGWLPRAFELLLANPAKLDAKPASDAVRTTQP